MEFATKMIISCIIDAAILIWFNYEFEKKRNYMFRCSVFTMLLMMIVVLLEMFEVNSTFIRTIVMMLFYLIALVYIYKVESLKKAITQTLFLLFCVVLSETSVVICIAVMTSLNNVESLMENAIIWLISLLLSKCLQVIYLMLIKAIKKKRVDMKSKWQIACMLVVFVYLICIYFCFELEQLSYDIVSMVLILNIVFIIVLFGGYLLFLSTMSKMKAQKMEMGLLYEKTKAQMMYYEEVSYYRRQLRQLKHDMKNHVLVADSLDRKHTKEEYLEALKSYFETILPTVDSGNEILDVLIQNKINECKDKNINFKFEVDFTKGDFINLVDIGILFGNVIDDVIRLSEKQSIDKRLINLKAGDYEEFVVIKVSNTIEEPDRIEHRFLYLEEVLKKYDGTYHTKYNDKENILTIVIPIKQLIV